MSVVNTFVNNVSTVVSTVGNNSIKGYIGDSTNNHRTVTVNQLVRFLVESDNKYYRRLGYRLQSVYGALRASNRIRRSTGRTDAVDINELIRNLENATPRLKRTLAGVINVIQDRNS